MKKWLTKEEIYRIRPWLFLTMVTISFYLIFNNLNVVLAIISFILDGLKPLIIAIGFAYVLNIPMTLIETYISKNVKKNGIVDRNIRGISITLTILFTLMLLLVIGSIIIPKIMDSIVLLLTNMGKLLEDIFANIDSFLNFLNIDYSIEEATGVHGLINMPWTDIFKNTLNILGKSANDILHNAMNFTSVFLLWFLAFVFSLYLLNGKEVLLCQVRKVFLVYLPQRKAIQLFEYATEANSIFKNFITGQLLVAIVVGIFYYLCLWLFGFPFPELIAMIIAICSLVPVFGPMFAMMIGAFLILSKDILLAFWFIIFFQIISQIEDNFIYPKIVGNSVGLPGLWVILSIFVLGDLFGIIGMLIAVPLTAFIYTLFSRWIHRKLKQKRIVVDEMGVITKK